MFEGTAVSEELRRKGVAAETIRSALGEWREGEARRIISGLAQAHATLDEMLEWKAAAMSYHQLITELERAMRKGGTSPT